MAMPVVIDDLPALEWSHDEGEATFDAATGALTLTARPGSDWINDPLDGERRQGATGLGFLAPGELSFSARVAVTSQRSTFDAAVLTVWGDRDHWAKLCFELSPQGQAMVVSVVTNGPSDDCSSSVVAQASTHLRVVRTGEAWAFHSSDDGVRWTFVRVFRLDFPGPFRVGMMAQAPTGDTCVAVFDRIALGETVPRDLRDGS